MNSGTKTLLAITALIAILNPAAASINDYQIYKSIDTSEEFNESIESGRNYRIDNGKVYWDGNRDWEQMEFKIPLEEKIDAARISYSDGSWSFRAQLRNTRTDGRVFDIELRNSGVKFREFDRQLLIDPVLRITADGYDVSSSTSIDKIEFYKNKTLLERLKHDSINSYPLFNIDSEKKWRQWITTRDNVSIEDDRVSFTGSPASFSTQMFKVEKHDQVEFNLTKPEGVKVNLTVQGYSNGSLVKKKEFTVLNGSNKFEVLNMEGNNFRIEVEVAGEANSNQTEIHSLKYVGTLPNPIMGGIVNPNGATGKFFGSVSVPNVQVLEPVGNFINGILAQVAEVIPV